MNNQPVFRIQVKKKVIFSVFTLTLNLLKERTKKYLLHILGNSKILITIIRENKVFSFKKSRIENKDLKKKITDFFPG